MLKKSALIFALLGSLTSFTSMASLITTTQTDNFTGIAGNDSIGAGTEQSNSDLQFVKFDTSLGDLIGVNVSYTFSIFGGSIGATSLTSDTSDVTATLGADIQLGSDLPFGKIVVGTFGSSVVPMFDKTTVAETFEFSLAGDPDTNTVAGVSLFDNTGFVTALDSFDGNDFLTPFKTASAETFGINFATGSINQVDSTGGGTQGNFTAVSFDIEVSLNYTYTAAPLPPAPPVGVPEPAVFAFGLLMLCAVTGRKFLK